MPKLIIMNAATEQMLGQDLTEKQKMLAIKAGWRNAWFAEENDIIIMPIALKENFVKYIGDILNFDANSLTIITPNSCKEESIILTDELLLSSVFIEKLKPHIEKFKEWVMMACYYSSGIVEMAKKLGIKAPPGEDFFKQGGVNILNRKGQFRRLAAGIHSPIAEGSVVYDISSLARAIEQHLPQTGTIIIKQDNNVCGMGNIAVTKNKPSPLPGVYDTLKAENDSLKMAENIWVKMLLSCSQELVVESYHAASHMLYVEYFIAENSQPQFLNYGSIRLQKSNNPNDKELLWLGLDIPAELASFSLANLMAESMKFALRVANLGYRGYFTFDAIITEKEKLIVNEINGRWGGCTILHILAEKLLGANYGNKYVICSSRNIDLSSLSLEIVLEILSKYDLAFNCQTKEGVLILACDERFTCTMECMIIGSSYEHIRSIENQLLNRVSYEKSVSRI